MVVATIAAISHVTEATGPVTVRCVNCNGGGTTSLAFIALAVSVLALAFTAAGFWYARKEHRYLMYEWAKRPDIEIEVTFPATGTDKIPLDDVKGCVEVNVVIRNAGERIANNCYVAIDFPRWVVEGPRPIEHWPELGPITDWRETRRSITSTDGHESQAIRFDLSPVTYHPLNKRMTDQFRIHRDTWHRWLPVTVEVSTDTGARTFEIFQLEFTSSLDE